MPQLGAPLGPCAPGDVIPDLSDPRAAARAIDALRRGWPIAIRSGAGESGFLAVETADDAALAAFDPEGKADILVSGRRAATLKLANQRDADPAGPVRVLRAPWIGPAAAMALADPARDLATPLKGPFRTAPIADRDAAEGAIRLARRAGLLPALFVGRPAGAAASIDAAAIGEETPPLLTIAARAPLPLRAAEKAEMVAFRAHGGTEEHVALLIGTRHDAAPLVRLHSECLTGDALGSLKCDCGPQLDAAIVAIAADGWGVLLYLRQEGRGIGLVNKLRAYALQDQGYDTIDANIRLGFAGDERDFAIAAAMLKALGIDEARLLTNNPAKAGGLEAAGIKVVERLPLRAGEGEHNRAYLAAKKARSGHDL